MSAAILIERLKAHGVTFRSEPVRAHCQNHGGERDTFLVDERWHPLIEARYGDRVYCEVGIEPESGCAKLARQKVYVRASDTFSGYGVGLWLAANSHHDDLFVMEKP